MEDKKDGIEVSVEEEKITGSKRIRKKEDERKGKGKGYRLEK